MGILNTPQGFVCVHLGPGLKLASLTKSYFAMGSELVLIAISDFIKGNMISSYKNGAFANLQKNLHFKLSCPH